MSVGLPFPPERPAGPAVRGPPLSPQAGRGSDTSRSPRASAEREGPAPKAWEGEGPRPFVVAIDGPAASGKSTLAHRLADRFGFAHLDTGALYRATGVSRPRPSRRSGRSRDGGNGGTPRRPAAAPDPRLRGEAVAAAASMVAAIPGVRRALLDLQRNFAAHPPPPAEGAVLDGRDIGSVVCPGADVKLFITAGVEERARRRVAELRQRGAAAIFAEVLQDLKERDARDTERRAAPLSASTRTRSSSIRRRSTPTRCLSVPPTSSHAHSRRRNGSRNTNQGGAREGEFCGTSR